MSPYDEGRRAALMGDIRSPSFWGVSPNDAMAWLTGYDSVGSGDDGSEDDNPYNY